MIVYDIQHCVFLRAAVLLLLLLLEKTLYAFAGCSDGDGAAVLVDTHYKMCFSSTPCRNMP